MQLFKILDELKLFQATLVAVTKTHSATEIMPLYEAGQRIMGENRVQELLHKKDDLPGDIEWHMIGHLQSNKVKQVITEVSMLQSMDSAKLYKTLLSHIELREQPLKVLLQLHVAQEETKSGFSPAELFDWIDSGFTSHDDIEVCGIMGMATLTDDQSLIKGEFISLRKIFDELKMGFFKDHSSFAHCSMGMSSDYKLALECGSTMVRIGSKLFEK